jgi:hypothetical protein
MPYLITGGAGVRNRETLPGAMRGVDVVVHLEDPSDVLGIQLGDRVFQLIPSPAGIDRLDRREQEVSGFIADNAKAILRAYAPDEDPPGHLKCVLQALRVAA